MSFYRFMKNFEGEKSHFGDLFEGMKDINFPENITTPKEIMEKFQHWLQEPTIRYKMRLSSIKINNFHL